ncbi:hypothetical protein F2Q69_00011419 [Brassica cretica]|uniref:Uncharacterized protein n=1 Tax=Brassica cretica TaxID=69181 RepID=A0A8S9QS48_BRACR|nr:hypothetical protein F2Q69_00011419 [Brassica cretica]
MYHPSIDFGLSDSVRWADLWSLLQVWKVDNRMWLSPFPPSVVARIFSEVKLNNRNFKCSSTIQ